MIMLMSMLLGLTPSTASALEEPTQVSSPKSLPKGAPALVLPPDVTDTSPKAYPIEPSKTPPPVEAWTPNKELIEKRTASSRTFSGTKPGQFETRLYSDAVNFEKDGKWVEIDSTLTPVAGGKLKNKANSFGLEIADYSNAKTLAKLQLDSTHSVSFGIDQAAKVKGKVAKDAVTYSNVKKFTDVRLTSQRNGLKEDLILSSPDAPTRFVFPLILQGLTASIEANGDVVYKDSKGDEWARTPHGFMFDSNLDPRSGESAVSTAVDYALIPHKDGVALEVSLDRGREWLSSPERVWPVTVDPQIHAVRTWGDDTYVMRNFTRNNSADPELKVGTYDGGVHIGQSYAHFDTAPLAGKQINSATLYAVEEHSWNCNVGPGPVYRVTQPWSGSSMTTFPGASIDSNQATGGWHSGACPNRLAHWVVTPQVAQMAAEGQTAGSFSFRAPNEADNNQYKKYLSFEAGNGPYLSVDYSTAGPTGDPIGSVDESTPVAGGIRVRGWVIDPDTAASTQVHIYVGSKLVVLDANTSRPDVGLHYPGYGDNHGFSAVISAAPGTHNVCFYGMNIAGSGTNPLLGGGCRTITVPGASVPGAPANATATANPDGTVTVNWGAAPTNPWSPVLLYAVYPYYANNTPSGDGKAVSCSPGPCTSTSFTGLPNASQFFYIFPYNAGQWGTVATTNTVTPKTIPSPPTNAVATAQPDGRVKVSWTLSSSTGGATMGVHVVYVFRVLSNGALEYANKYSTPCATCTEDFFDDLTAGTTYRFYVYATNTVSHSATAAGTNAVVVIAAQRPSAPTDVTGTGMVEMAKVTWTSPTDDGGSPITKMLITAIDQGGGPSPAPIECAGSCLSSNTAHFEGLLADHTYKFVVAAMNVIGGILAPGAASSPSANAVTQSADILTPTNVQATAGDGEATVTWNAPSVGGILPLVTGYTVKTYRASDGAVVGPPKTSATTSATITDLPNATPVYFKVIATTLFIVASPESAQSNTVSPLGVPFAPAKPTATIVGEEATVSWSPPAPRDGIPGDNGSSITGYTVNIYRETTQAIVRSEAVGASTTQMAVSGLINGTPYFFTVQASNQFGISDHSPASDSGSFAGKPFAAVNVQASGGLRRATVSWDPPPLRDGIPGDNGGPITAYKVEVSPSCSQCTGKSVSGTTYATIIEGLNPATTYTLEIVAENGRGIGDRSLPAQAETDREPPEAPTNVRGSSGIASALIEWDAPKLMNGAALTGYTIISNPVCECAGLSISDPDATSSNVTGLINGMAYTFTVVAESDLGQGEPSLPSEPITPHQFTYWALGDSFSSGQGAGPYDWDNNADDCKRSSKAYGPLLAAGQSDWDFEFKACAGNWTTEIPGQIQDLPDYTELVTISVGGNDLRWIDVLDACLRPGDCRPQFEPGGPRDLTTEIAGMEDDLTDVYRDILNKAEKAKLIVFTYPQMFTNENKRIDVVPVPVPPGIAPVRCMGDGLLSVEEIDWLRARFAQFNAVIIDAVSTVNAEDYAQNIQIVRSGGELVSGGFSSEPAIIGEGLFDDHQVCNPEEWITGLTPNNDPQDVYDALHQPEPAWVNLIADDRTFHPNALGYSMMHSALVSVVEESQP